MTKHIGHTRDCKNPKCRGNCEGGVSETVSCSTAERQLVEIYETQAIEAAMFMMAKLNRGQIKRIREANPNMADFYAECLSR